MSQVTTSKMNGTSDIAAGFHFDVTLGTNSGPGFCELNLSDDRYFLAYFIMGTYFGPDIEHEKPRKSALQRFAESLPPYTSSQLGHSNMTLAEVEKIYYFLLRNACQSVMLKLPSLQRFFQGKKAAPVSQGPLFPLIFPSHLHPLSVSLNGTRIIENIVYIESPQLYYHKQEDIERFKMLTGLKDFFVPRSAARPKSCMDLHSVMAEEPMANDSSGAAKKQKLENGFGPHLAPLRDYQQVVSHLQDSLNNGQPKGGAPPTSQCESIAEEKEGGPAIAVLPSMPSKKQLNRIVSAVRSAYVLSGSAAKGQLGPVLGLMDMGESEDSYMFRISLPGVKRQNGAFRCEVESEGKVLIKGETITGEKMVYRFGEAFEMLTQNHCPPGPFEISFHLPGPVDPRQFTGSFGTDGILEAIVMKR